MAHILRGCAAVMCGKALPFRQVAFILWGYAPDERCGHSPIYFLMAGGKAEHFRISLRHSREEHSALT